MIFFGADRLFYVYTTVRCVLYNLPSLIISIMRDCQLNSPNDKKIFNKYEKFEKIISTIHIAVMSLFFWFYVILFVFSLGGEHIKKDLFDHKIEQVSFLKAEGGPSFEPLPSISHNSNPETSINPQTFPLIVWFDSKSSMEPLQCLQAAGIKEDFTTDIVCSKPMLESMVKQLKSVLKELIITSAQIYHLEEGQSRKQFITSTSAEFLAGKKRLYSDLEAKAKEQLENTLKCLLMINLDKYSKKLFVTNSVNCNPSSYLFYSSILKMSKRVLEMLEKIRKKIKNKYKKSTKVLSATFDHETLKIAEKDAEILVNHQRKFTNTFKHFKKKCKMYIVQQTT